MKMWKLSTDELIENLHPLPPLFPISCISPFSEKSLPIDRGDGIIL